jgi:phosphoribosylformimino-5-aminoimidazole carboxamide ribotide isomerase
MEVIPAIDLLGGRVVRLSRGDFDAVTDYGDDPVAVARRWADEGATRIHVVDLDAAREGKPLQAAVVAAIVASAGVRCQVAGGIRGADQAAAALAAGVDRVILGSALISWPTLGRVLVERHGPDRIVAALDVRGGRAVGDGWVAGARGRDALALAEALAEAGVRWFAVTAIDRDGGLGGPDLELLEAVRAAVPEAGVIASGAWVAWLTSRCWRTGASRRPSPGARSMKGPSACPRRWPRPPRPCPAARLAPVPSDQPGRQGAGMRNPGVSHAGVARW